MTTELPVNDSPIAFQRSLKRVKLGTLTASMVKKDEKFDSEIVGAAAALDLEEIAAALGADLSS